eukprot:scaffold136381_cov133-Phaeocystis_antarctica.AAC.1
MPSHWFSESKESKIPGYPGKSREFGNTPVAPYEARHRLKLLHRRQASPTGGPELSRLKRALLE